MSLEIIKQGIDKPEISNRFAVIYKAVNKLTGESSNEIARNMLEVERFSFLRIINEKGIADVAPISAAGVFLEIISAGLSFNPGSNHVYLMTRNVKSGQKTEQGKDIYEKRLVYTKTVDGKIYLAQRSGSVETITTPVIVYECDQFSPCTNEAGDPIILHRPKFPRPENSKIMAAYCYITHANGFREPVYMTVQEDVKRLVEYSAKNNSTYNPETRRREPGNANELYFSNGGQIDTGFFATKLIHKALKNKRTNEIVTANEVSDETAQAAQVSNSVVYTANEPEALQNIHAEIISQPQATIAAAQPVMNGATHAAIDNNEF